MSSEITRMSGSNGGNGASGSSASSGAGNSGGGGSGGSFQNHEKSNYPIGSISEDPNSGTDVKPVSIFSNDYKK